MLFRTARVLARTGVATPTIDALLGLTRLFARVRGLYDPPEVQGRLSQLRWGGK